MAFFGPGGNEEQFYEQGYKSSDDMPEYLSGLGLNAYEYQCTRGVKINQKTSEKLGENARKFGIKLSIHAPYYINPATDDEEKRQKGIKYITDTLCAAKHMGAERIVVHSGGCAKCQKDTAACTEVCRKNRLCRYIYLPRNYGQNKSARNIGRSSGALQHG